MEVVIFSISRLSVRDVNLPCCGLSDKCDGVVGAMPRISEMCAADLDDMFLAFIARALWLNFLDKSTYIMRQKKGFHLRSMSWNYDSLFDSGRFDFLGLDSRRLGIGR